MLSFIAKLITKLKSIKNIQTLFKYSNHLLKITFVICMTDLFDISRRVHISEKTLQCLNGEFEVEPAFGEKREETLRAAGLKTYFIKKVLVPVSELST